MLFGSYTPALADGIGVLSITQNGENTYYQLNDIRKLTFDAESMFITLTDYNVVTLPFSTLVSVCFGEATGITTLMNDRAALSMSNGELRGTMHNDGKVLIYDTSGKVVKQVSVVKGFNIVDVNPSH